MVNNQSWIDSNFYDKKEVKFIGENFQGNLVIESYPKLDLSQKNKECYELNKNKKVSQKEVINTTHSTTLRLTISKPL